MQFESKWITTERFSGRAPIDVYHKELKKKDIPESDIKNYHVLFKKKFKIEGCQNIKIKISADDYYKLYINGRFVCQGPAPAYPEFYNYNEIDISEFVNTGANIITVHVYYQGCINRVWNSGDNRQGMIADVFADGEYICGTDNSWYYTELTEFSGETTGYETTYLENIDFNLKDSNWKTSYSNNLKNAVVADFGHTFANMPVECVDVYTITPERIVKINDTDYFVDFGREITGQFFMRVNGEKNQRVTIKYGEETESEMQTRYKMRCNCEYIDECTLSGGIDEFEFYDYKAFRYVNIETDRDNLNTDSFETVVRHHKFEEKIKLKTDVKYLNEIWDLCVHTLKIGVQEGFLDCPTREKGQYLGDFTVSGLAYLYITGDAEIYKKTLWDFAHTSGICPGLMSVAPGSIMQEIADFSLQYPLQILNYYNVTNDKETVEALYPIIENLIEYFKCFEREDGLLDNANEKWNLVDWPQNLRDGYDVNSEEKRAKRPCHNVLNAFYIKAVQCFDEINKILGKPTENRTEQIKKAYLDSFYDADTCTFYDTESHEHSALHSNVLAVYADIAPKESYETIRNLIMSKGLCCGTQFSYFVLKALAKMEAYEDELALVVNESEHSWVNMLREGATTCFEAWGKEQKWNTSLCHPWSCSPIIAVVEDLSKTDQIKNTVACVQIEDL